MSEIEQVNDRVDELCEVVERLRGGMIEMAQAGKATVGLVQRTQERIGNVIELIELVEARVQELERYVGSRILEGQIEREGK
jgi:hypothetical protein